MAAVALAVARGAGVIPEFRLRHLSPLDGETPTAAVRFPCVRCARVNLAMNLRKSSWRQRWAPILVMVALAAAAIVAVPSVREPVLRAAGWALVVNEPVAPADIIVLSLDSEGAGALEGADL